MELEERLIKFDIKPKIIYSLCLLKDRKLALGMNYILIVNQELSKALIIIKNKDNHPIYQIIQSKKGFIVVAENNLIKVYIILNNNYSIISIYNGQNQRVYKLRELSNGNIAYSSKYFFVSLFHSLNFKKIKINYDLNENKSVINFIEMNKNILILLCVKVKDKRYSHKYFTSIWDEFNYKYRFCYFYIQTLEKINPSLWQLKDMWVIQSHNINYFVTRETMKIIDKKYLFICISNNLNIYNINYINGVINFVLFKSFNFHAFIQCLCLFNKDILTLGTWSGNIIFLDIKNISDVQVITEKNYQSKIRNLMQLNKGNIICVRDFDESEEEIILIKDKPNINKKLKIVYHHNRKIKHECEYLCDKIIKEKLYNKKGNLILNIEYLNAKNIFRIKHYNDNGEFIFGIGEYKERGISISWNKNGQFYDQNGKLVFEGEYLDGKRWKGKGTEYNNDGKLVFEGEYLDGKKWNGKGREYNDDGNLIFDGIFSYGIKSGKLKKYKYNKLQFEGELVFNKIKGKGKKYYKNGNIKFEGRYYDCKREGNGKDYYKNGQLKYEAEYSNGKRNGYGKQYYINGKIKFEGEYLNGKEWNGIRYNNNGIIECDIILGKKKIKE